MAGQAGQRRLDGRPQLPATLKRLALAVLAAALAGCARAPFEWRAEVSASGVTPLPVGTAVVAARQPPNMAGFLMRSLEPFVPMSESQANRCYHLIRNQATNESLQQRTAAALGGAPRAGGYPQLLVSVAEAALKPQGEGVAFELRASAQGALGADNTLRPSTHIVRTPSRKPEEWLDEDSRNLRADLDKALDVLAASIASTYRK